MFGEWFLRTFPDPTSWLACYFSEMLWALYCFVHCRYSSRLAYAHTTAVMSIVGYILGLGDRHGENILFDSTNGDCVHVDFNCLFNRVWCALNTSHFCHQIIIFQFQGETFDVPEVVPFRLTHNMTHGLVGIMCWCKSVPIIFYVYCLGSDRI